jgi:glycosyltransferase involved in cell wall biosynthesis
MKKNKKICVVLYSRRHFNPAGESELLGSSAGQIASAIYFKLKSQDDLELHYFDAFNHYEWKKLKVDILVSIVDNLPLSYKFFNPNELYVVAVNQHPLERLRIASHSRRDLVPFSTLSASDGIYQPFRILAKANGIVCVGNTVTINTYKKYMNHCKIIATTYKSVFNESQREHNNQSANEVLVLMSSIGYRKGFDRIAREFDNNREALRKFKFHIVGEPENDFWKGTVDKIVSNNENVNFYGWLDNESSEFRELLQKTKIAVFPTREEGMVGSLLEVLDLGLIPLHTVNSGVDNTQGELTLEPQEDSDLGLKLLALCNKSKEDLLQIQKVQVLDFNKQVLETFDVAEQLSRLIKLHNPKVSKNRNLIQLLTLIRLVFVIPPRNHLSRFRLLYFHYWRSNLEMERPVVFKYLKVMKNTFLKNRP